MREKRERVGNDMYGCGGGCGGEGTASGGTGRIPVLVMVIFDILLVGVEAFVSSFRGDREGCPVDGGVNWLGLSAAGGGTGLGAGVVAFNLYIANSSCNSLCCCEPKR